MTRREQRMRLAASATQRGRATGSWRPVMMTLGNGAAAMARDSRRVSLQRKVKRLMKSSLMSCDKPLLLISRLASNRPHVTPLQGERHAALLLFLGNTETPKSTGQRDHTWTDTYTHVYTRPQSESQIDGGSNLLPVWKPQSIVPQRMSVSRLRQGGLGNWTHQCMRHVMEWPFSPVSGSSPAGASLRSAFASPLTAVPPEPPLAGSACSGGGPGGLSESDPPSSRSSAWRSMASCRLAVPPPVPLLLRQPPASMSNMLHQPRGT